MGDKNVNPDVIDPAVASGIGQFGAVRIVAPSLGVDVTPVDLRDPAEIERAVTAFAHSSNGGLIVTGGCTRDRSSRDDPLDVSGFMESMV
jgi:hypothetical protein